MTLLQGVFVVTALAAVISAVMVVASPRLVHAALWLVVTLGAVAVLFILLDAGFLAMVQVVIYIGAIAILIIFTVMLTRRVMADSGSQANRAWWLAVFIGVVMFAALLALLAQMPTWWQVTPPPLAASADFMVKDLGKSLVDLDRYVVPFEVASVLLLAALIGAIVLARPPAETAGKTGAE
ncbi:MAG TPA: NADH-quinone oxidoreductase subunit J [Anaerolineales bacterium]|nr:NADH-quinone oxidoreductase subunit J [Anaerolineales bacterium]